MTPLRVLVLGGYGFFGSLLVRRLVRMPGLEVLVAGRSEPAAQLFVHKLGQETPGKLPFPLQLDASAPNFAVKLRQLQPHLVINTCGPFQGQGYHVARACIAANAHYVDLADGREFVQNISQLDAEAKAAGVSVISGASSVPAISSAVLDHFAQDLQTMSSVDIGINPANQTERGLATIKAVLSYCGKPLPGSGRSQKADGAPDEPPVIGWGTAYEHDYPAPVGKRLLSACDVPDLVLFSERYAGRPSVRFGGGQELRLFHRAVTWMSWATQRGYVKDWSQYAPMLKWASDKFICFGTAAGAMHVQAEGVNFAKENKTLTWHLVAEAGDGPYVPTLPAAALVRKFLNGVPPTAGARPCVGELTLSSIEAELEGLHIWTRIER